MLHSSSRRISVLRTYPNIRKSPPQYLGTALFLFAWQTLIKNTKMVCKTGLEHERFTGRLFDSRKQPLAILAANTPIKRKQPQIANVSALRMFLGCGDKTLRGGGLA